LSEQGRPAWACSQFLFGNNNRSYSTRAELQYNQKEWAEIESEFDSISSLTSFGEQRGRQFHLPLGHHEHGHHWPKKLASNQAFGQW
jgi:hypothetical protein